MERLEEIRKRSKGINEYMHNADKAELHREDCIYLLSLIDQYKEEPTFGKSIIDSVVLKLQAENMRYKKESELTRSYLVTIGNIARRQDNIHLQEINRHVDDILDSLRRSR